MAWTFISRATDDSDDQGRIGYRMTCTDGREIRTIYHWSSVTLSAGQLITIRDAILDRLNNPPAQNTLVREINQKILEIDATNAGTTAAIRAAKWDAVLAYRTTIVGADQ